MRWGSSPRQGRRHERQRSRRSNHPEIPRRKREDRVAEALGTDPLEAERDGVVVRDEAEEFVAGNGQAACGRTGYHLGRGAAVLQQTDLAEKIAGFDHTDLFALDHDSREALEHDVEAVAVAALAEDDLAVAEAGNARQLREALDGLHVPVLAE